MSFHYNVIPKAGSGYSTRVSIQPEYTQAQLLTDVATDTGLTTAQIEAVGTSLFQRVITAGRDTRNTRNLFGLLTFLPRCGGSFTNIDFQPTPDKMGLGINGNLTPDGLALLVDGITFTRDGVHGEKVPLIERVYDASSRTRDKYTPGGGFKIGGEDFSLWEEVPDTVGIYLQPVAGGARVRVASYIGWKDSEISGVWPLGPVGAQNLIVETRYGNSSLRTTTYTTPLQP